MKQDLINILNGLNAESGNKLIKQNIEDYVAKIIEKANVISYFDKGNLVGFIAFYLNEEKRTAFLTMLAVNSNNHNQGIGNFLLNASLEIVNKNHCHKYELEVLKGNSKAMLMYKKNGFEIISENDSHYIMQKDL
jgi:ribosomal protein S18 acetylase RimI-like enzyme